MRKRERSGTIFEGPMRSSESGPEKILSRESIGLFLSLFAVLYTQAYTKSDPL